MTYTAVAVGNFDGVHLGHIHLINTLKREAEKRSLKPLVITFDPHPIEVLQPFNKFFCKLNTGWEKRYLIEHSLGIKTELITFTEEFSQIPPEVFVEDYLINRYGAKLIIVGYDWKFGKDAKGNVNTVKKICSEKGCEVIEVEPFKVGGKIVSSTLIRELLKKGKLKEASLYLGHPYWIARVPVKGKGLGKRIGFPTLNFEGVEKLCLPNGVYAVLCDGNTAVANLGFAPTLKGDKRRLEVHLLEDKFPLTKQPFIVFKKFLRPEIVFKSAEELKKQIERDIEEAKRVFQIS
jgi:riboflavin kinase/FMN adenylyltransferase